MRRGSGQGEDGGAGVGSSRSLRRRKRVAGVVLLEEEHLVSSPERTTCTEASSWLGAIIYCALVSTSSSHLPVASYVLD